MDKKKLLSKNKVVDVRRKETTGGKVYGGTRERVAASKIAIKRGGG